VGSGTYGDIWSQRSVAWRELDLHRLGIPACRILSDRERDGSCPPMDCRAHGDCIDTDSSQTVADTHDVRARLYRLDFFRADSIESAFYILTYLGDRWMDFSANGGFQEIVVSWDISMRGFQLNVTLIGFLILTEAALGEKSFGNTLGNCTTYL